MNHDANMDPECIPLCDAINSMPGLRTLESCCGHGKEHFRIWFAAESLTYLPPLLYYLMPCHIGFRWNCYVTTDCGMSPVHFRIESETVGEEAYGQSKAIAKSIAEQPPVPVVSQSNGPKD
jgi:hypothetical protein